MGSLIWIYVSREGLRNTVTTKHATENLLKGNYGFKTDRLSRHSIVKGRNLGSKSRIKSFLGRSFMTVKITAVSFLLKLAGWFQNE